MVESAGLLRLTGHFWGWLLISRYMPLFTGSNRTSGANCHETPRNVPQRRPCGSKYYRLPGRDLPNAHRANGSPVISRPASYRHARRAPGPGSVVSGRDTGERPTVWASVG